MKHFAQLVLLVLLFSMSYLTAGTGKAILPTFMIEDLSGQTTYINLTNITQNPINITITVYKQDGTVMTSGITYDNFTSGALAAKDSGTVTITATNWTWGYAVIEWSNQSGDNDQVALIAAGRYERILSSNFAVASMFIPINRGQAF